MKTFDPTANKAPAPLTAPAPPAQPQPEDDGAPRYQPAHHLFPASDGDGVRNTLPLDVLSGWTRPAADLSFDIRQMTIAEHCRARRIASSLSPGSETNLDIMNRQQLSNGLRRIGDTHNPDDATVEKWIEDIGYQGWHFVWNQFLLVHSVGTYAVGKYEASKRADVLARRVSYVIPGSTVPRKRWAARMTLACAWVHAVDDATLVDTSHWTVDGQPAEPGTADTLSRDLAFTLQEMKQGDHTTVSDLAEDPDDYWSIRMLEVMWSLVSIGGRTLTNSPADLAFKRRWLEDIGPRALNLVTGTWVKMHEVDHARMATFLDAATPLD